jgi:hypothetical protein
VHKREYSDTTHPVINEIPIHVPQRNEKSLETRNSSKGLNNIVSNVVNNMNNESFNTISNVYYHI